MTHNDTEAERRSKLPAKLIFEAYPAAKTEGSMLKDTEAYLNSKNKFLSELMFIDSTINRKGTTIGAAAGVKHESDELDICLARTTLEPNKHTTADILGNVKLLDNDTETKLPPR